MITIGNFDGVHVGHQAILAAARVQADRRSERLVAFAFDPHPARVLRPRDEPPRLLSAAEKENALRRCGADEVCFLIPSAAFLDQSPQAFMRGLSAERPIGAVVEGPDFHFGKGRVGNVDLLRQMGCESGFDVTVVEPVHVELADQVVVQVRSSLIRWLLGHGRVADATVCLGRPYGLSGVVGVGEKSGRKLGFPTVNLDPETIGDCLVPADGVYAGRVLVEGTRTFTAAISIGLKPTFGRGRRVVEAHLLNFTGDLYKRAIRVEPLRWLRDQQAFPSVDHLRAQLRRDIARTRWLHERQLLAAVPGRAAAG